MSEQLIFIEPNAIKDADSKRINVWLNTHESHLYQTYLISEAARLTAEAGNAMVAGEESDIKDAENFAEEARLMLAMAEKMAEMRDPEKAFTTVLLKPKPVISKL